MHQLALYSLILRVGHKQLPVIEQHISHAAQYACDKLLRL